MDFDIGDVGADDPIEWTGAAAEGSSHAEAPVTLKGRVTQRLVPTQELPPEDFVLADPQVPLPVLRFQLLQPGGVGCTQRVRCSLWGLWCDRLSEVIKVGHEVAITGATVERHEDRMPGDRTTATLAPAGTPASASVIVETNAERYEATAARCVVRRKSSAAGEPIAPFNGRAANGAQPATGLSRLPLQLRPARAAGPAAGAAGTPAPAAVAAVRPANGAPARPAKKAKTAARTYAYTTIAQMAQPSLGDPPCEEVHVFGGDPC